MKTDQLIKINQWISAGHLQLFAASLWLLLCLIPKDIVAQPVFRKIKKLNTENGLSQNSNDYIYQDRLGFMWLSSWEGLNRFDGRNVRVYKPNDHLNNSITGKFIQTPFFEDPAGDIWFTTENSINCYRRKRDNFDHYFVNTDTLLPGNPHRAVFLEKGRYLWVNADTMLYRFDTRTGHSKRLQRLETLNYAAETLEDGSVHRLFACYWLLGNGFDMITFDSLQRPLSNQSFFSDEQSGFQVQQALVESSTEVWFATDRGILKFNPKYPSEYSIYPYRNKIKNIAALNDSTFLVADSKGYFLLFNKITKKYYPELSYQDDSGATVKLSEINIIYYKDDIIWVSLMDKGLLFFSYTENAFEYNSIPARYNTQPIIQILEGADGLVKTVSNTGTVMQFPKDRSPAITAHFGKFHRRYEHPVSGQYWVVSSYKTELFSPQHHLIRTIKNASYNPNCAAVVWNDQLFIAGDNGLYRITKNALSPELLPDISTQIAYLYLDHQDQTLWIGSDKDLKACTILPDGHVSIFKNEKNTGVIHQIAQDPKTNDIWVAAESGLYTLDHQLYQLRNTVPIAQFDGAGCRSIAIDSSGNVWIGTNSGLYKYQPAFDKLEKFTKSYGLKSSSFISGAGFRQRNGYIWMGGENGVDVFDPEDFYQRGKKPNIVITDLWVNGKAWSGKESIETAQKIELQYFENSLTFGFAALEYTNPADNFFKVMLKGADHDWHYLERTASHNYQNLPPGEYTLYILAANAEGIWQTTPRVLTILIKPHFTSTWWFRTLVAGFLVGIISIGVAFFLLFRLREEQLTAEKKQRESEKKQMLLQQELALRDQRDQISASIHDDLGAGLSNIRIASERALKKFSSDLAQHTLGRIAFLATELDENRRSLAWATDPEMDNLESLMSRIRSDAIKIFDQTGIHFSFHFPEIIPPLILPGPFRLHLLRAVKECLNNILRHAQATNTDIRILMLENKQLVIFIKDNGKGFDPESEKGTGKGLRAIAKHLQSTGGKIEWIKNTDTGMTLRMEAPFPG